MAWKQKTILSLTCLALVLSLTSLSWQAWTWQQTKHHPIPHQSTPRQDPRLWSVLMKNALKQQHLDTVAALLAWRCPSLSSTARDACEQAEQQLTSFQASSAMDRKAILASLSPDHSNAQAMTTRFTSPWTSWLHIEKQSTNHHTQALRPLLNQLALALAMSQPEPYNQQLIALRPLLKTLPLALQGPLQKLCDHPRPRFTLSDTLWQQMMTDDNA